MTRSSYATATLSVVVLLSIAVLGSWSAGALPIASGSKCSSDWVNNGAAMQCFIKGEEETRSGEKHPHYVACTGAGEVFCCVDDDNGNQNCDVAEAAGTTTDDDKILAILAAHRAMLTSLGRLESKPK
jgi:hypothetical protein